MFNVIHLIELDVNFSEITPGAMSTLTISLFYQSYIEVFIKMWASKFMSRGFDPTQYVFKTVFSLGKVNFGNFSFVSILVDDPNNFTLIFTENYSSFYLSEMNLV